MDHIVAVVGAESSVGRIVLGLLCEYGIQPSNVVPLVTSEHVGKRVGYGLEDNLVCESLHDYDFCQASFAIFVANEAITERYAGAAADAGCIVIDSSSFYRKHDDVPLVLPGVNDDDIVMYRRRNIISIPDSATNIVVPVLHQLQNHAEIKKIVMSSYYAVSYYGKEAMNELHDQTKGMFMNKKVTIREMPRQVSFNCIPCVGEYQIGEATTVEDNISCEMKRMLGDKIGVAVTCAFVPVFVSHAFSINVEFDSPISREEATDLLGDSDEVLVVNEDNEMKYVTPVDAVNDDEIYVSRIRRDTSVEHGLSMWIVSDNLRRGVSIPILRVVQVLCEQYL